MLFLWKNGFNSNELFVTVTNKTVYFRRNFVQNNEQIGTELKHSVEGNASVSEVIPRTGILIAACSKHVRDTRVKHHSHMQIVILLSFIPICS